jgi:uncharacterized protein
MLRQMVRMIVDAVALDQRQHKVVLLKDIEGRRILPIWIGPSEARAIALELEGVVPPRPLSHDLLISVVGLGYASIMRVVINDLQDDTYYAVIELDTTDGVKMIDARPSDAIALAVRAKCPIFVAGAVLDALVDAEDVLGAEKVSPAPTAERVLSAEEDDEIKRFQRLVGDLDF